MSKKKGKKSGSTPDVTDPSGESKSLESAELRTLEYYELKVKDMTEKLDRLKTKCDQLQRENDILVKAQSKFNHDKADIVEFLNIKVSEHEKLIAELESRIQQVDEEKKEIEHKSQNELDTFKNNMHSEIENLQMQCTKYRTELTELSVFSSRKEEMEHQIKQYRALLEKKDAEYRDTIHNLERKVLQDKNQMKREMLQKVNEAVANFRRVADQQMAETTKRAIRENMAITAQLKKMSAKTMELISDNDGLNAKVKKLKIENGLLVDSEKKLAKRNQANQRVIKMLVEKLKESDQMLELAFESDQMTSPGTAGFEGILETGEVLTDEIKAEIQAMQDDYDLLVGRLHDLSMIATELEEWFFQCFNSEGDVDEETVITLKNNLSSIIDRIKALSHFQTAVSNMGDEIMEESSEELLQSGIGSLNMVKEEEYQPTIPSDASNSQLYGDQPIPESDSQRDSAEDQFLSSQNEIENSESLSGSQYESRRESMEASFQQEDHYQSGETIRLSTAKETREQQSNAKFTLTQIKRVRVPHQRPYLTDYQKKVENNFLDVVSAIPSKYSTLPIFTAGGKLREIGVQTQPLTFGPPVNAQYLLGEVRPWGTVANCLPKKGLGLYHPRVSPVPPALPEISPTIHDPRSPVTESVMSMGTSASVFSTPQPIIRQKS